MLNFPITALGLMSGTSIDGLDLALVRFESEKSYQLLAFETIGFSKEWFNRLNNAPNLSGLGLGLLDVQLASWMAEVTISFLAKHNEKPHFIASHGYTVHHVPAQGLSLQIGNPAVLAAQSGYTVVGNFRQGDVALGGQGAPLVPAAEPTLFPGYQAWLNLGGIANLTYYNQKGQITASDLVPCNQILNKLAQKLGFDYDQDGQLAKKGKPIPALLNALGNLSHYQIQDQKPSLGREWVELEEWPVYEKFKEYSVEDLLASSVLHIAGIIGDALNETLPSRDKRMLVTGGGAHHTLLMALIGQISGWQVEKPSRVLVDGKEALVFAWLGMQRMRQLPNTLPSVTGAIQKISAGGVYLPPLG